MKKLFIGFLILFSFEASAQSYLNMKRRGVKKGLERYLRNNKYTQSKISGDDSTLVLSVTEPGLAQVEFTYHFNADEKCIREVVVSDCDSCFKTHIGYAMGYKKLEWKKISEGVWVSPFRNHMLLQVTKEGKINRALIHRIDWNRKDYEKMMEAFSLK